MKCLILLTYFNRPILIKNAIKSILNSDFKNWELFVCDDGSDYPAEPILNKILSNIDNKITYCQTNKTIEQKCSEGISIGKYVNEAINNSNADFAVILGDDDELLPTYMSDLKDFYTKNPGIDYCYSHVYLKNPLKLQSQEILNHSSHYNNYREPINCYGKVDGSQVSFRLRCCKEKGAWLKENTNDGSDTPWIKNTDAEFFQSLYDKCGPAYFSGLIGEIKGIHDYQFVWYKKTDKKGFVSYLNMIKELANEEF